jgi:acetyl esterase/lipase
MNLTLHVIKLLAALSGNPLRTSSIAAPDTDPDSTMIDPDQAKPIKPGRTSRSYQGIAYSPEHPKLRMDLLVPAGPGPHPVVLYLPGGGFVSARRQLAGKERRYVAESGFVVASIDYRTTAAGATYRDALADVAAALAFLRTHATEYNLDPDRIAVWGESAGGYLTAMAATEPANGFAAAVSEFGASDLSRIDEGFDISAPAAIAAYVLGPDRAMADHPEEMQQANPATRVTEQTPPFLLLHGDDDRMIPPLQTAILHQALLAAGIESARYVVKGAGHGTLSANPAAWSSKDLMDLIVDFLHAHLSQKVS